MRDRDIRTALYAQLRGEHPPDDTWIFNEFGVAHGAARVDIGLVNGSLEGYEIKSEHDTLRRLPAQVTAYNRVFDRVSAVASGNHVDRLVQLVPSWWGIRVAVKDGPDIRIDVKRKAQLNPAREPLALAELLWRDELLEVLGRMSLSQGLMSKPKRVLQRALVDATDLDQLAELVRNKLKSRDWRSD
jgi:hypothetical protein